MQGYITEDHHIFQKTVQDFCKQFIQPVAGTIDKEKKFPRDLFTTLGEYGFLGINVPESLGGSGADYLSYILALEELARVSPSIAVGMAVHCSVSMAPIIEYGNETQKNKYIPGMVTGKKLGAFALTEAGSGSDSASIITTFSGDDDGYTINGSKIFCTNANYADIFITTATTDRSLKAKGIAAFIAERNRQGLKITKGDEKLGLNGSDWGELYFDHYCLPKENMLASPGEGFKLFMKTLNGGRISIGAISVGLAQGALEEAIKYAKQREQFNKNLMDFQAIQHFIADMTVEIEAARHLVYSAARMKDLGMDFSVQASKAKLYASQVCMRVANKALQIHGGYGYTKDFSIERYFRDARCMEIVEGTSEVQKIIIAKSLLASSHA